MKIVINKKFTLAKLHLLKVLPRPSQPLPYLLMSNNVDTNKKMHLESTCTCIFSLFDIDIVCKTAFPA